MDRDDLYINDEIPYDLRDMAAFILCFHLSSSDIDGI